MPKYFEYKVCGYYLYFTSHCTAEAMHAHASDRRLEEAGSAKFFIKNNGDTVVTARGKLKEHEIRFIQVFIKDNYKKMFEKWSNWSNEGFYGEE